MLLLHHNQQDEYNAAFSKQRVCVHNSGAGLHATRRLCSHARHKSCPHLPAQPDIEELEPVLGKVAVLYL